MRRGDTVLPFWAGQRLLGVLVGALVGMLVVTGVVLWTHGREPALRTQGEDAVEVQLAEASARDAAVAAASKLTEAALSYKWDTLARDRRAAEAGMTAGFRKQYRDTMAEVAQQPRRNQVALEAEVVAAGLVSADAHRATVLVFTNQSTTTRSSEAPQMEQNRVLATLTRADGDWRLSGLQAF
jgi:Mce-associated membrane protein